MLGEPIVLGVIVGALIGAVAQLDIKKVLFLGVTMGAVMELIPRITKLFIDGLKPIAEKTQEVVQKKWAGKKVYIGMSPALVIGHPTTLVASLILIPLALLMAVALPGNEFLPLASLAGMFYVFVMVLPYTKGNVVKTLIVGIVKCGEDTDRRYRHRWHRFVVCHRYGTCLYTGSPDGLCPDQRSCSPYP